MALNTLEAAVMLTKPDQEGKRMVTLEIAQEAMQRKALLYDKGGEEHYNVISAFIKSMRGSDPDAALYWLARMLDAGEDPLFTDFGLLNSTDLFRFLSVESVQSVVSVILLNLKKPMYSIEPNNCSQIQINADLH